MLPKESKTKLAIFASGSGSNALKIIEHFKHHDAVEVALIVTNRNEAGVIRHALDHRIEVKVISKQELATEDFIHELVMRDIDFIILAGFLLLIPKKLIRAYPRRILNIHPALLPKYGGKGMYGIHIHRAVKENAEQKSGITIHLVNEHYDKGRHLFQKEIELDSEWPAEKIAKEVLKLEHKYYPRVIEQYIKTLR